MEKGVARQIEIFNIVEVNQSAYCKFHNAGTALLKIYNDILMLAKTKVVALVLIDLSVAFDTIDHNILIKRHVLV